MADKIAKLLAKLSPKQLAIMRSIIAQIIIGDYSNLDTKMIKGHRNIFRVRAGKRRIIFTVEGKQTRIISIDRRNEKTYRDF